MKTTPYTVNYKRVVDLFPPPDPQKEIQLWDLRQNSLEELIDWLDQEKFTGVLKASSKTLKFRGALLLFAGWCVGALFAAKDEEPIKHTDKAIPALLTRLNADLTSQIEIYNLPDEIVLPFSSAFIGQFMEPVKDGSPSQIAEFFIEHISDLPRHCLITVRTQTQFNSELCLVFFYWGKISGHFLVEEQTFSRSCQFPDFVFDQALEAKIHLSILSPEIVGAYSGFTRFGFPLTLDNSRE